MLSISSRFCRRHLSIFLGPSEEVLDGLEDMYEPITVRKNVLRRLWKFGIKNASNGRFRTIITESITPAPAKITFVVENTWIYDVLYEMRC